MKRYTGTLVYTRECVNLVTHTNFTVVCVIEADFWSIRSMREQVVIGVVTQAYQIRLRVKGHFRSPILVPIESSYSTSY